MRLSIFRVLFVCILTVTVAVSAAVVLHVVLIRASAEATGRTCAVRIRVGTDEDGVTPIRELVATFESTQRDDAYTLCTFQYLPPEGGDPRVLSEARWNWDGSGDYAGEATQADDAPPGGRYRVVFRTFDVSAYALSTVTVTYPEAR